MTEHSAEPWTQDQDIILAADSFEVADCFFTGREEDEIAANGRRISAAVNACVGIPTEALEQGVVAKLVEALEPFAAIQIGRSENRWFRLEVVTGRIPNSDDICSEHLRAAAAAISLVRNPQTERHVQEPGVVREAQS